MAKRSRANLTRKLAGLRRGLWIIRRVRIAVMADAYRAVVGLTAAECPDAEAIDRMLNPARNPYRRETLNIGVHAPMMRPLQHANFTFAKKISHTADSQDQRHRMVPGSRPLLTLADTRSPDYITPMLIRENPRALEIYQQAMEEAWAAKNELLDRGVRAGVRALLAAQCQSRFAWWNPARCLHLLHKWTMRTCFNAQEEIYQSSIEEVEQVRAVFPRTRALHRPALLSPRWNFHAHLHGRLALLRRKSLAGFSEYSAPHMTRRGSLIYYLAAWALGCFFMVLAVWCENMIVTSSQDLMREAAEGFLTLDCSTGTCSARRPRCSFGLLLRRIMLALKCKTPMHWAVAGAILAPLVVVALGIGSRRAAHRAPGGLCGAIISAGRRRERFCARDGG